MKKHLLFFSSLVVIGMTYGITLPMEKASKGEEVNAIKYFVPTSQGKIAVWDSQGKGEAVLLIHGNSASGEVFKKQLNSPLGKQFRLIAPDLAGHGASDRAKETNTYSFPGYARVLKEVVEKLGIKKLAVVGWSLGGHIALELYHHIPGIVGILITGTPPMSLNPEDLAKGYQKDFPGRHLVGQERQFTEEEAKYFMSLGGFKDIEEPELKFLVDAAMQTHGTARSEMIQSVLKGQRNDEVELVRTMKVPLAIIAGARDAGINTDYIINDVTYGNLWHNKVYIIKDAGHAVFWDKPQEFNEILEQFLKEVFSTSVS